MSEKFEEGKIYNVELVNFNIKFPEQYNTPGDVPDDTITVEGISDDGFGITPTAETEPIEALKGYEGFSIDPSSGAEISLTLKSVSPTLKHMIELYKEHQEGELPPFQIEIAVDDTDSMTKPNEAFGFSRIVVQYCMFVNYAAFETDGRESPDYEFEFVGYNYNVEYEFEDESDGE